MQLPEITLARMLIWKNLHLAECTFPRKLISRMYTGAYLGGALGHGPPLRRQDSIISVE